MDKEGEKKGGCRGWRKVKVKEERRRHHDAGGGPCKGNSVLVCCEGGIALQCGYHVLKLGDALQGSG